MDARSVRRWFAGFCFIIGIVLIVPEVSGITRGVVPNFNNVLLVVIAWILGAIVGR